MQDGPYAVGVGEGLLVLSVVIQSLFISQHLIGKQDAVLRLLNFDIDESRFDTIFDRRCPVQDRHRPDRLGELMSAKVLQSVKNVIIAGQVEGVMMRRRRRLGVMRRRRSEMRGEMEMEESCDRH
eukprot:763392-Hanusia_phi.AAC.11